MHTADDWCSTSDEDKKFVKKKKIYDQSFDPTKEAENVGKFRMTMMNWSH